MNALFLYGIVLIFGFISGEFARIVRLPKVTGYIMAGILLNPQISHFITRDFVARTEPITDAALSFITFTIGASLVFSRIKNWERASSPSPFSEPKAPSCLWASASPAFSSS